MDHREDLSITINGILFNGISLDTLPVPKYTKILNIFQMRTGGPNREGLRVFRKGGASINYQDWSVELGYVTASQFNQLDALFISEASCIVRIQDTDIDVSYTMLFTAEGFQPEMYPLTQYREGIYKANCDFHILRKN